MYDNIADAINRAGLRIAATARSVGGPPTPNNEGIAAIYVPLPEERMTAVLRLTFFKCRWRSDEVVEVLAAHCSIRADFFSGKAKYPTIGGTDIVKYREFRKGFISIPSDHEMPFFSFNLFDMSDRLGQLENWAISQAEHWLMARLPFNVE